MNNIFQYENWPYFFIAIVFVIIVINAYNCHNNGKRVFMGHKKPIVAVPIDNVAQVSKQVSEQTAAQVAARIASETTNNVLTEAFVNNNRIPNTFTNSVKHVSQRENFSQIEPYNRDLEGVDIGAKGYGCDDCDDCECTDCYKNLNDQINLGVNNYIFPNCNNDYMCLNGCNIHDQINNYQFDYRMGQSATELERSRSGMYTSLNVDSCSQECPSMGWMPPMTTERVAAAEYISTLEPVKKN